MLDRTDEGVATNKFYNPWWSPTEEIGSGNHGWRSRASGVCYKGSSTTEKMGLSLEAHPSATVASDACVGSG
jgi:hypothetical protein